MYTQINTQKLKKILDDGLPTNALLVDVRTRLEYNAGHLAGAINIPVNKVLESLDQMAGYDVIYFQCQSGGRSALACELLSNLSADLYDVSGGLQEWIGNGYPLVR